jgi:formylglycine-generating enzyme required for sulfatase activity
LDIALVTAHAVRDALRNIRYARPLGTSVLVSLTAVTVRLRAAGVDDSATTREWMLARLIEDLVTDELSRLRPAARSPAPHERSAHSVMDRLRADFALGCQSVEAWSLLHAHYLADNPWHLDKIAHDLAAGERTVERRLCQGHALLAEALRVAEVAAERGLRQAVGTPAHRRAVPDPAAATAGVGRTTAALRAAVTDATTIARTSPDGLREVARHPAADLVEYRLGGIAKWSDPRYALDERFVALSLLVDRGDDCPAGRWARQEQRYTNLQAVLDEAPDPALVLLGPPGCGKSTLLRRLDLDLASDGLCEAGQAVSFFVPLNTYRSEQPGEPPPAPGPWLAAQWSVCFPALPGLEQLLAEGRMVLLLDGLNEMPHRGQADYRELILGWKQYLHEMVQQQKGNRLVFSCRTLDYSAPLSTPALRVPQVQVEPMTDDQVRRFLELYAPSQSEMVWGELAGTPQLDLLRSPYFLHLAVEEVEATGTPAYGRAALFTGFVRRALKRELEADNPLLQPDALLAERDYARVLSARRWRDPHELPERGCLFPKLAALAYGMQATSISGEAAQVRVSYDEALAVIADDRAPDIVRAAEDLGVLDEDRDRDEVLFRHQLLQEYFAARRLARQPNPELVRREWRADRVSPTVDEVIDSLAAADGLPGLPQTGWEETTLLAAAMTSDPAAFVRDVMDANLSLAGRIAARPAVRARLSFDLLDEVRWALVHRSRDAAADLRDRIACAHAVGDLGDPRYERRTGPDGEYLWPPLVEVPGGVYPIGDDERIRWECRRTGDVRFNDSHVPRHQVAIAAFRIGQFAVTNAEWACFMTSGGYRDERWWNTVDANRWQRGEVADEELIANNRQWRRRFRADPVLFDRMVEQGLFQNTATMERLRLWSSLDDEVFEQELDAYWKPRQRTAPAYWHDPRFNQPSLPVVAVTWYEARAYCNWLSAQSGHAIRLPTEVQWEAAARGMEGRRFPWGEAFDRLNANTDETHVRRTTPVGVFPSGDTPLGVADLAGNTYDWTSSLWGERTGAWDEPRHPYPYDAGDGREDAEAPPDCARVVRGGSTCYYAADARAVWRENRLPSCADYDRGLRLVWAPEAPPGP